MLNFDFCAHIESDQFCQFFTFDLVRNVFPFSHRPSHGSLMLWNGMCFLVRLAFYFTTKRFRCIVFSSICFTQCFDILTIISQIKSSHQIAHRLAYETLRSQSRVRRSIDQIPRPLLANQYQKWKWVVHGTNVTRINSRNTFDCASRCCNSLSFSFCQHDDNHLFVATSES